jgi:hypothetical protein
MGRAQVSAHIERTTPYMDIGQVPKMQGLSHKVRL